MVAQERDVNFVLGVFLLFLGVFLFIGYNSWLRQFSKSTHVVVEERVENFVLDLFLFIGKPVDLVPFMFFYIGLNEIVKNNLDHCPILKAKLV